MKRIRIPVRLKPTAEMLIIVILGWLSGILRRSPVLAYARKGDANGRR